jgi:hypothetical protein
MPYEYLMLVYKLIRDAFGNCTTNVEPSVALFVIHEGYVNVYCKIRFAAEGQEESFIKRFEC